MEGGYGGGLRDRGRGSAAAPHLGGWVMGEPGFWPGLVGWVFRLGLGQPEDEEDDQDDGNDGSTDVDAASGLSHVGFLPLTQRAAHSAHMAEAFNGGCVFVLGDRPDVEAHEVHVGLEEGGQLARVV